MKEIFNSGELEREATARKFRVVQKEGNRSVKREIEQWTVSGWRMVQSLVKTILKNF